MFISGVQVSLKASSLALPPKQLMAVPLATIRITYPEKLVIQIVKSPISQDNRRSIVFHKYDTAVGHRGPSSTTGPFLLKLACAAPAAPAPRRLVCRALSGGHP